MSLPVVIIVGRPNVGKSTLLNRIIQNREAIVDNQPGVTRDRKYVNTEWSGREFVLVDTGGYIPFSHDKIEVAIVEQVKSAIDEADVIIFLVDARAGITGIDEEIARLLKKSGKNVVLGINKVDTHKNELFESDFYSLGIETQIGLSAANGRNIGDFLDVIVEKLPETDRHQKQVAAISLAVIGRPNVGKSSFVNSLLGKSQHIVTDIPGTTRDSVDTLFKYYNENFLLIDTAGLRKKSRVKEAVEFYSTVRSLESIKRCDVAILLIDATTGFEAQDMKILHEAIRLNKGIVLAVNKWDLIEKDSKTAVQFERKIRESLKSISYLPILFISALTKQRIFRVIDVSKTVYEERGKTIKTSVLNDFLSEAVRNYAPPSMDRKEVKLNYCTQVKSNPPVIVFFTNAPKAIRANYRSYLENQLRKKFGFFGVPLSIIFRKK